VKHLEEAITNSSEMMGGEEHNSADKILEDELDEGKLFPNLLFKGA
jgi:hypothetical protein